MPLVIGVDPGTVSIDLLGLRDGIPLFEKSLPTREALSVPEQFVALLTAHGKPDLVAGPSGYGLPLIRSDQATEADLRLALLAPDGESGGIGGLGALLRLLIASELPVVFTPGVIHLPTVPPHRKLNRIDLGTADKVAAAALAIRDQMVRLNVTAAETSFILLELGGAFTAALAVDRGAIVDGIGGTAGPMGFKSSGGWDGEVAFLAGQVGKDLLFRGGRSEPPADTAALLGWLESAHKAVLSLTASVTKPREILLSGRHADDAEVAERLAPRLEGLAPVRRLEGFAGLAKQGAQGAAILADGLAGGPFGAIVASLRVREAGGTVLDYLRVITPEAARRRVGL
jgi:predicted butyrate kinase (DUF1464 family)